MPSRDELVKKVLDANEAVKLATEALKKAKDEQYEAYNEIFSNDTGITAGTRIRVTRKYMDSTEVKEYEVTGIGSKGGYFHEPSVSNVMTPPDLNISGRLVLKSGLLHKNIVQLYIYDNNKVEILPK